MVTLFLKCVMSTIDKLPLTNNQEIPIGTVNYLIAAIEFMLKMYVYYVYNCIYMASKTVM